MSETNKRYQVFVSSTYADLKEERGRVIQTLMEMDCIPAGMELFPAVDEEQFEFIKRIIDDCDYYLLIIGGRYGSIDATGISYTEKEFDYAIEKGLKVVALLHGQPEDIPSGKTDRDVELAKRLQRFREKAETNRLVKYWKSADELPGIVSLSLMRTIKTYPAIGWVRGGSSASTEILQELNAVRKQNEELRALLNEAKTREVPEIGDIAGLDGILNLSGVYRTSYNSARYDWSAARSFGDIFSIISPYLIEHPSDQVVKKKLTTEALKNFLNKSPYDASLEDHHFQTLKIQLKALGLVNVNFTQASDGSMALFWSLTEKGERVMTELRVIRTEAKKDSDSNQADIFEPL